MQAPDGPLIATINAIIAFEVDPKKTVADLSCAGPTFEDDNGDPVELPEGVAAEITPLLSDDRLFCSHHTDISDIIDACARRRAREAALKHSIKLCFFSQFSSKEPKSFEPEVDEQRNKAKADAEAKEAQLEEEQWKEMLQFEAGIQKVSIPQPYNEDEPPYEPRNWSSPM